MLVPQPVTFGIFSKFQTKLFSYDTILMIIGY